MVKKISQNFYISLIFVFLYAPIVILAALSFNRSKSRNQWGGFTLKWYRELFQNEQIMTALANTLFIAFVSALTATVIGTLAAIAINSMKKRARSFFMGVTNIPMLNADIVTGISLMLLFLLIPHFKLGITSILIAHITFNIPYVILSVAPKLKQINKNTYEAAMDLGASSVYAFFKVVFPDILPGILSGFLLAFTMSLDDFVITHFTKGPGIDTLSTKIYTEVRKGIKPEIYSLSTLLFGTVLVLLILMNLKPAKPKKEKEMTLLHKSITLIKFVIPSAAFIALAVFCITGPVRTKEQVYIYNWGEYIDPKVLELFEKETGIHPIYDEYEQNEDMYPKIKSGAVPYDVVCPSDYTIEKMKQEGLLKKINFENVPNIKNIGSAYLKSASAFDPGNQYAVPYCWGTVGILYNKKMIKEPIDSWSAVFDPKYKKNILMINNVRDAFGLTLKYLGYSLNSTDEKELNEAKKLLSDQSPLVQAYVIDQVRDKMIGNEAAIGVIYSGEAIYTQQANPDLEYVIPKEGANVWIDAWVIPKTCQNKENAEAFINFLCKPEIAKMNFDYITYSTPNTAARELIEDEDIRNSTTAFPDAKTLDRCETFKYLGEKEDAVYNKMWKKIKSGK